MKSIAFIGIDGAGKTTLIKSIKNQLEEQGEKTVYCRYKQNNSQLLDRLVKLTNEPVTEQMKLCAYSFDLLGEYIKYKNFSDSILLWDRYSYCLEAYFTALDEDMQFSRELLHCLPAPDLTFYVEIPVPTALKRITKRGGQGKPLENELFLKKVQANYQALAKSGHFVRLDGERYPGYLTEQVMNRIRMMK